MLSTSPSPTKRSRVGALVASVALIAALVFSVWLVLNRQYVVDQISVWQYQPSSEVTTIASRAKLSDEGTFYLYASRTQVDDAAMFNKYCQKVEEHSAILGCYSNRQIYIYNVTNTQLDGIKEVTAVHEMLHAVWDRLDTKERDRVSVLLENEYEKHATAELKERMEYYARAQPGERANELHSIIGSEMKDISSELEQHYKVYLLDRSAVVKMHDTYVSVFESIEAESTKLESQLSALGNKIDSAAAVYNKDVTVLNADIQSFNSLASGGGFASQAAFDQERAALEKRASALRAQRQAVATDIKQYTTLLARLKVVNAQSSALSHSIDSTLTPSPAI